MRERPVSFVPKFALFLLAVGLCAQIAWQMWQPKPQANAPDLPAAPSLASLRLASLGEPIALAKVLMLYVQSFDAQAGVTAPFARLDYGRLTTWLDRILDLDPQGQYPLFAASRLYSDVADPQRQRLMLNFIYRRFSDDPNQRWPWLAQAAIVAKHRLKDLPLAQKYAHAIRVQATASTVPSWARQMEIFILEDMNELDSAKILLGGLLQNHQITDQNEIRFLEQRLKALERKTAAGK